MTPIDAVILGVIQGLTEFFPLSATGHLVLVRAALGITEQNTLAFDAMLELATAAAIVVYFFGDIWLLVQTILRKFGRLPVNDRDVTVLYALLIGTLPALILGVALPPVITALFQNPLVIAGMLVIGSCFFMYAEWIYFNQPRTNDLTLGKGFRIGLLQAVALMPGFSRAGVATAGGMIFGLTRSEATRVSFLLGVPLLLGVGVKLLLELIISPGAVDWLAVAIGTSVAFFSGLLAIQIMVGYMRKHSLWAFIWYRIILAAFVLFIYFYS